MHLQVWNEKLEENPGRVRAIFAIEAYTDDSCERMIDLRTEEKGKVA